MASTAKPASKPAAVPAVAEAKRKATIPTRPVIRHVKLFRAELQVAHKKANGALMAADNALALAAEDRDIEIAMVNQRFEAIRADIDAERADLITTINGIEAALAATAQKEPEGNVVPMPAAA